MFETHLARGPSWAAKSRVMRALGAAVILAVAGGLGVPPSRAGAMAAALPSASAGGQFGAWTVTASIPVQSNYPPLAVNSASHTVYAGSDNPAVEVINGLTGKQTAEISLPARVGANSIAVNPSTGTVYVVDDYAVYAVNGKTNKVTATIADTMGPIHIAVNPDTNTVYVSNLSSDTVTVINGKTNAVTTTITISNPIDGIAVDPVTDSLYVADGPAATGADGEVTVINGATNKVTTTVGTGANLNAIAVNPQTDTIYAAGNLGSLAVISGTTDSVTATVKTTATSIAVAPLTDTVYLADNYLQSAVLAMSGQTNEIIGALGFGNETTGLAVDPAIGNVYVSYIQIYQNFETPYLGIVATCPAGVVITPGTSCARVAAAYQPEGASFASPSEGVLVGGGFPLVFLRTSDAGKHWSFRPATLQTGEPSVLARADDPDVLFTSPDNGWLFGYWHTRDGGVTWQRAGPDGRTAIAIAATPKTAYGVAPLADNARVLYSRPTAGTHWTRILEVTADITDLAANGSAVWLTSANHLWTTADGRHWHEYPARCPGTGYHMAFVAAASPSDVAFLCTRRAGAGPRDPKELLTSTNGGRTVHLAGPAPATGIPNAFAIAPGDPSVITIAANATLYRSANGGRTWTTQRFKGYGLGSLTYTSRTTGWVVLGISTVNTLLHTTDSGRTWHKITF